MYGRRQHKNPQAEVEQFRRRAALGFIGVLLGLGLLGGWYFKLQVLEHDEYATRSEANRIKARPVVPGRGLIYDRNGKLLAENVPAFRVDVTPNKVADMEATLAGLREIFALSEEDIERFNQSRKSRRSFIPVTRMPVSPAIDHTPPKAMVIRAARSVPMASKGKSMSASARLKGPGPPDGKDGVCTGGSGRSLAKKSLLSHTGPTTSHGVRPSMGWSGPRCVGTRSPAATGQMKWYAP